MTAGKFVLYDVGASMGIHTSSKPLNGRFNYFGFEPNDDEYAKLRSTPQITWINAAVGDKGGLIGLHLTKAFQNSSARHPNGEVLVELALGDGHSVVRAVLDLRRSTPVKRRTSITPAPFIKLGGRF
jgi:hypothetical protein